MSVRTLLLADDDKAICTVIGHACRRQGYEVLATQDGTQLMRWVENGHGDVVITDVLMGKSNGFDLLPRIKSLRPELPVIVISAQNTLLTAVKANQLGAYDYLPKPFDLDALMQTVGRSLHGGHNADTIVAPSRAREETSPIIGRSAAMQDIYRTLARMVDVDLTVMITGESGTGKELVARAMHHLGARKNSPFIALNMAAIPRELVESELFGHEKGAFTGAVARKNGAFAQSEGGTLFLDEIGDMPLDAQTRLLRVLQQGEYTAVGGTEVKKTNVRIITATHRDLLEHAQKGLFREDLYYRLNVVQLRVPALRERQEDIDELTNHFLGKAHGKGLPRKHITPPALKRLHAYSWPGNVRELENFIYRLVSLSAETTIDVSHIDRALQHTLKASPGGGTTEKPLSEIVRSHVRAYFASHEGALPSSGVYDRLIPLFEKPLIETALEAALGNQLKAAQVLGINRNTLRKKINQYGIETVRRGAAAAKSSPPLDLS